MARPVDYEDYDEDDVRTRPGRRGSRPRTKDRPRHRDARAGVVLGVDRGRYRVLMPGGHGAASGSVVTAMRARELHRRSIVVGDEVALVGDTSGGPDALARIVRVEQRRNVLRRSADDTDAVERVIVANVEQLVIVTSAAQPEPRPRLIDRCLVAAYDADLEPVLLVTKADLADPAPLVRRYAALDLRCLVTTLTSTGIDGLARVRRIIDDRVSVLVGHSGVGKSTLVNALVPDADRATGVVNDVTGRGRHTSTSALAFPLPDGGWVVDTPGVRSFGLGHVQPGDIVEHFPDLAPGTAACPRGCSHDEPDCALDEWVADGRAGAAGADRLDSLRRLLRIRNGPAED